MTLEGPEPRALFRDARGTRYGYGINGIEKLLQQGVTDQSEPKRKRSLVFARCIILICSDTTLHVAYVFCVLFGLRTHLLSGQFTS